MKVLVVTLFSLLHLAAWAADADPGARFSLKQPEASTGTNIKREVARGSLPFDKKYSELTAEQRAQVKAQYERMGPDDEPPFPLNGLAAVYQAVSAAQDKLMVTGLLSLAVEVNSQGEAVSVSVLKSNDPAMTQFAATVLMNERYKPALCAGKPCTMQFPFRIQFERRL